MKNSIIKVKNELPELIEAVCNHPDCPEWLKDGIWETFNNQNKSVLFSATYWRCEFEAIAEGYEIEESPEIEEPAELPANVIRMGAKR